MDVSPGKESESSLWVGQHVVLGGCWEEERLEEESSKSWELSFDVEISCSAIGMNF